MPFVACRRGPETLCDQGTYRSYTDRLRPHCGRSWACPLQIGMRSVSSPHLFFLSFIGGFAYYAMLEGGIPAAAALAWLERAREAGWRSRFTLKASTEPDCLDRIVHAWRHDSRC